MTLYVNRAYYFTTFEGALLVDDDVEKYLKKAQEKIDSITHNRIVRIGFDNLTEFQKEKVKEAICYQAEYIKENGYNNSESISSYSVLDISVSIDKVTKSDAESQYMSEEAYEAIQKTGLASNNWRFNG